LQAITAIIIVIIVIIVIITVIIVVGCEKMLDMWLMIYVTCDNPVRYIDLEEELLFSICVSAFLTTLVVNMFLQSAQL
jgi:hypothetical protein